MYSVVFSWVLLRIEDKLPKLESDHKILEMERGVMV